MLIRRPPTSTLFPLHDALPISLMVGVTVPRETLTPSGSAKTQPDLHATKEEWERIPAHEGRACVREDLSHSSFVARSEEHTSELQSRRDLVCRLLLEKKKLDHA